jgi:hypothetical protein
MLARVSATASSVMAGLVLACPGHPRLCCSKESKAWMPGSSPGMTDLSRDANRARVMSSVPPLEGVGNAGRARRTRSLACESKKHTSVVTTVTPKHPAFPHAMVLRLIARSPR